VDDSSAAENWAAVDDAIRERLRELRMSKTGLARETGLSETTIRYLGRSQNGHYKPALIAISVVLRWRRDYLVNILRGQPEKNVSVKPPGMASLERLLHAEVAPLKDDLARLGETIHAMDEMIVAHRAGPRQGPREAVPKVEAISDLPMLNDIDADYSPQYVKLARILRDKIRSGALTHSDTVPAAGLAAEYHVSVTVAYAALDMLAANRYVAHPDGTRYYRVTWDAGHPHMEAGR
jgi:transposase